MSQENTEDSSQVLKPRQASYQFAPSSIQGWNDCPILPRSVSSSSVSNNENEQSKKASSTNRRSRRPMYVSHIDYQSQGSTLSIPKSRPTLNANSKANSNSNSNGYLKTPPRLNSTNIPKHPPSKSQISNNLKEDNYKNVLIQIQELIRHNSSLDNEQHCYHSQRISETSILESSTNIIFLHKLFDAWNKSNRNLNDENVINILYDFTNSNSNISWLLSLKTLMSNIKE